MRRVILAVVALALVGAGVYVALNPDLFSSPLKDEADFFKDDPKPNAQVEPGQFPTEFIDSDGKPVSLKEYAGHKSVVIVFTRGYHNGQICVNCSAQLSRLVRSHAEFVKRDTEVLMVFPGPKDHLDKLLERGQVKADNAVVPFRILLDPDFVAVDRLGIRGSLAKPATYILDKEGKLRFAYVGEGMADRPSIKGMLDQLDQIKGGG